MGHSCSEQSHDHCDHSHDYESEAQNNLYNRVDTANVVALNGKTPVPIIIKPWNQRMDESISLESDADDQLIIRVPFTGSVKLRSVLIKAGPGDETPDKVCLFPNEGSLDFDDVENKTPSQEFAIPQSQELGIYTVKPAKFSDVRHLTLFFPAAQGADNVRIYYLGFQGEWKEIKDRPTNVIYEAQANPADHQKIKGLDGQHAGLGL